MISRRLMCLLTLLLMPSLAAAEKDANIKTSNSIHFVALPYLNSFHYDHNRQPSIVSHLRSTHDLSDHNWTVTIHSIPGFIKSSGTIQTLDTDQTISYRLTDDLSNIIIPIPEKASLLPPMHGLTSATSPLWLQYTTSGKTAWHCPSLTPNMAAQVIAAKKEAERLSKRMADRAFYFGYDTNEDALK